MSFLDRFQNKIATVTAHGHLKKADGSEEIRVGPPKRKPQQPQQPQQSQQSTAQRGNQQTVHIQVQPSARGNYNAVAPLKQAGKLQLQQPAQYQPEPTSPSSARHAHPSPNASPRSKTQRDYDDDNNYSYQYQHQHPPRQPHQDRDYHQYMPGRPDDDYGYHEKPMHGRPSPGKGTSPDRRQDDRYRAPPQQQQPQQYQQYNDRGPQSKSPRSKASYPQQDELPSPRERNETRVHSDEDQLAFSRKARPVQFAPCTLSQYKKEKPAGYYELGKLQPDLNAEELVQKRANLERIKSFSKNLRAINMSSSKKTDAEAKKQPREQEQKRANSSREKALEFSKHIPKPRIQQRPLADPSGPLSTASSSDSLPAIHKPRRPINSVQDDEEDDDMSTELEELQMRHQASRAQVEALMRNA